MENYKERFYNSQSFIGALKTIITYIIVGGLWISFSDSILQKIFIDPILITKYQTIKGWFFIISTAIMLYFLIRKYSKAVINTTMEKKALIKLLDNFSKFSNDVILLLDDSGRIVEVNDRAIETYGYSEEEFLKLKCKDICGIECKVFTSDCVEKTVNKNKNLFEGTHIRKDGSTLDVEISSRSIEIDGKIFYQNIVRDITERKKAEQALQESQLNFKELVDLLPQNVFEVELNGILKFGNRAGFEMFGYSPEDLKNNLTVFDMIVPEDRDKAIQNFQTILSGKHNTSNEYMAIKKNGEKFPVMIFTSPIIRNKKLLGARGILIDISPQKKADEALRNSEERYRQLVESSPDAVVMHADGKIIFVNAAAVILMGAKNKEELIGKNAIDFVHPDYRNMALNRIKQMILFKRPETLTEEKFYRLDGSTIFVEVAAAPINYQGKTAIQVIVRDISKRNQAEEQIRILLRAVEQNPNSIVITDTLGNIEYVNPKFSQLTGYSLEEVLGKNPRILKSGETSSEDYKGLWESITSGTEWHGEFHNKKKNGEFYWESASITPIRDSKNNITHFLATKEDITIKKLMTKELIEAKDKAEESDRLKSQFLAQMSHEIRTPLNIILSYSSLLKDELGNKVDDGYSSIFNSIDTAGKRLLRTINLILNMAAVQTGNLKPRFIKINLNEIIDNLIYEFKNSAEQKNISLKFISNHSNHLILTDDYIITEILQNLIDNAIKYTNNGGVDIKTFDNNDQIRIEIKDSGIGISKEYLPKLFNAFSQEEMGYSRKFEGNGLGLALVKNYCDLIGAQINVESEKGIGTTFNITLNKN